ncbi:MAG TPA: response regulator [Candidatus Paceibacterota bacterium]
MNEPRKILIIDDDTFLLDMYTLKFKEQGFNVESATSAEDALNKLRNGLVPHVILFDVVMPGVDGLEMLEVIKKEKLAEHSLLIALSNQGEDRDIERARDRGADEYIVKANMIPSEVLETVSSVISKHLKT